MNYLSPRSAEEALRALESDSAHIIAGGTDLFANVKSRKARTLIDITGIGEMSGISTAYGMLRIGSTTTWDEIGRSTHTAMPACLRKAALQIGSSQIQHMATIGGNVCQGSPAADGIPALIACRAKVEIIGSSGKRLLDISSFLVGKNANALTHSELLSAILIPVRPCASVFYKLANRSGMAIAVVSGALNFYLDTQGRLVDSRVVIGACSPVAQRITSLEAQLDGEYLKGITAKLQTLEWADDLTPRSDLRASSTFRHQMAGVIVHRMCQALEGGTCNV